jgi:DNA-binding LacI/PurR family transcriptional regulator
VQYLRPALTTIRQPVQSTAETIIATLNEQLGQNVRERSHRQTLLRPELIVRASTGRAPQ